jgi:hypothetical protein
MDILPLPHNPTSAIAKVPYVCSEKYDGLAFLTFPARKGRPEMVSPTFPPGAEFGMHEKAHPTPVKELESLYQTWLYFGLLCEFLNINEDSPGVPPRVDVNKVEELDAVYQFFIASSKDGEKTLTSLPILIPDLELWKWEGDEETRKVRCRHLFECLRITHWMLQWLPSEFDPRIRHSIAALAEFFNFNLGIIVITSGWKDVQTFFGPWAVGILTKGVQNQMRDAGWCPSAIKEAEARYNGLQTFNIICKMEKPKPVRDHSRCTTQLCVNYQIDASNYTLSHAEEGCSCSTLEVDINAITEILMMGESSLPLLEIVPADDLEDLRIDLVPSSLDIPYVALSHVWADGLGNPFSNSLHRCQLARLKGLIERLDTSTTSADSGSKPPSLLWLDTLCCPAIDGPGKQKSIQKLRQVYQEADKVLVLDASLFSVTCEPLHTSEIAIRAYTSPWMRRLWTLQGQRAPSTFSQPVVTNLYRGSAQQKSLLPIRRPPGLRPRHDRRSQRYSVEPRCTVHAPLHGYGTRTPLHPLFLPLFTHRTPITTQKTHGNARISFTNSLLLRVVGRTTLYSHAHGSRYHESSCYSRS